MNTDIILYQDWTLVTEDGDFVVDQSDAQHIEMILALEKGELKQYPDVGVGMLRYTNGVNDGKMRREIKLQLEADGYDTSGLEFIGNEIIINAPET